MKPGEKGFTHIELIIAITIMALIGGAACIATFQVLKNTERNSNHMTAVRQVQQTGYWISRDTSMAESVITANLTPPDFLRLNWVEEESGDEYEVVYTMVNMPDSERQKLQRSQSINGEALSTTLVAQHIDTDAEKTKCEFDGGTLTLTVTATVGNGAPMKSECRTYQVVPRPS